MIPSRTSSSSTLHPAARDSDTASIRPRNRRLHSAQTDAAASSSSALSSPNRTPSRGVSPIPPAHIGSVTGRNNPRTEVVQSTTRGKSPGVGRGLLDGSWTSSWASVQELASSLLTGGGLVDSNESHRPRGRDGSGTKRPTRQASYRNDRRNDGWGPEPPNEGRPRQDDIAAGSRSEREATLKAMRTASVLESHEGVNGGLDVARRFKKRSSDEDLRETSQSQETEAYLAYIHHVQATDTYAGIVLRYRCREDAFRKANGLWSRDNIQVRKWLAMPVEACEVRGRPCEPPTKASSRVDLLARTPDGTDPFGRDDKQTHDFFSSPTNGHTPDQNKTSDDDSPWTHVRWVSIDSHPHPVEVARVPRKALGYFPPRRKKSIHTISTLSTPRASTDLQNVTGSESGAIESPHSSSSRRPSILSARGTPITTTTSANRNRLNSTGSTTTTTTTTTTTDDDPRPAWMRRPGGVGSLGRHVRAPGPERDYFNTWTNKHLPGLNIDSLPSMSIMGSEMARFGFARRGNDDENASTAIAESPFAQAQGQDGGGCCDAAAATAAAAGNNNNHYRQGTGLDKAAASIETWLRVAFERARQGPLTPVLGPRGRGAIPGAIPGAGAGAGGMDELGGGDLIELTDTGSEDGRLHEQLSPSRGGTLPGSGTASSGAPGGGAAAASGRSPGAQWAAGGVRGRGGGGAMLGVNKKAD